MAKKVLSGRQISSIVKKVAEEAKKDKMPINKAYIFGSYARKTLKKNDLDLCFVSSKFRNPIKAEAYLRTKIYLNFDLGIPVDIVAYNPKDFKKTIPLVYEILKNGREVKI